MPVTRISTVYRVDNSEVYDDTLAMALAESIPADIQDDLNFIRTQLRVISGEVNWYDPPQFSLNTLFDVSCRDQFEYTGVDDGYWTGTTLTLASQPSDAFLVRIFLNGQLLSPGVGYTIIPPKTFDFLAPLEPGDNIEVIYPCIAPGTAQHNTLNGAYNEGGASSARIINANEGAVFIISGNGSNMLELHNGDFGGDGYALTAKPDLSIQYNLDGYQELVRIENFDALPANGYSGRIAYDISKECLAIDTGTQWRDLCQPINWTVNGVLPPSPGTGDRYFDENNDLWYTWSGSYWISDARPNIMFNGNTKNITNQYLRLGEVYSNLSGFRLHRKAIIKSMSVETKDAETWNLEVRKNGFLVPEAFVSLNVSMGTTVDNVDIVLDAGDRLEMYCNGTQIGFPVASLEIAWIL